MSTTQRTIPSGINQNNYFSSTLNTFFELGSLLIKKKDGIPKSNTTINTCQKLRLKKSGKLKMFIGKQVQF